MKVRVFDGGFHAVDSDAMSFELCAKQGFREAARKAKPVLLEPIMKVEVITPDQYMGDVTGDLNRRRGMLEGMDTRAGAAGDQSKSSTERNVWLCNATAFTVFRPCIFYHGIFSLCSCTKQYC